MTDYREILRLKGQGISQRSIAVSCGCSRNTIANVFQRAEQMQLDESKISSRTNPELEILLFPERQPQESLRRTPDCERIHKEMAKSGVTLTLLWHEYCESCRQSQEIPLMYTQFCNHYRQYASTTKATMHIHRKPGEQMEVDWAGQVADWVDRDTGDSNDAYVFVAVLSSSKYIREEGCNCSRWYCQAKKGPQNRFKKGPPLVN